MEKKLLRKHARHVMQDLSFEHRKSLEKKIAHQLFSTVYWKSASTVGITLSRQWEWDTKFIIEQAWAEQKKVYVPKCYPDSSQLIFYELTAFNQLECVYLDLQEPKTKETKAVEKNQIDLLVVPGLLFDRNGYRLGYGGGYYDRFLVGFVNTTLAIASEKQLIEDLPKDEFDIPVQHLITEDGLIF